MARLIWTERALSDLEAILLLIESDAPVTAKRFASKIVARVELLQQFPMHGELLPEDRNGVCRQVLQGSYRIIYRQEGEAIYLVAVHHAARLLEPSDLG